MKKLLVLFLLFGLTGCATTNMITGPEKPTKVKNLLQKEFDVIPPPAAGKPVVVAVYSFADKTGQRRPSASIANLSTAVTQGAEAFLIKALQDVGKGQWFTVVERVGIDSLTKERQLIRQMREAYDGANAKPLAPMMFAGVIVEGGITGYDSSTKSGGYAARMLGIGPQTQYSEDIVTVSLRLISVNTGKVLASVNVQKTIYSTSDNLAVLKFIKDGTQAFELEAGLTINEPGTQAVKAAVEAAVVELIKEGQVKGVWDFKTDDIVSAGPRIDTPSAPTPVEIKPTPAQQPVVSDTPTVVETPKVETTKEVKKQRVVKKEKVTEVEQPSIKAPRAKEQVNVQLH
jgi:curli production assembly/transport component CsgG